MPISTSWFNDGAIQHMEDVGQDGREDWWHVNNNNSFSKASLHIMCHFWCGESLMNGVDAKRTKGFDMFYLVGRAVTLLTPLTWCLLNRCLTTPQLSDISTAGQATQMKEPANQPGASKHSKGMEMNLIEIWLSTSALQSFLFAAL